MLYGMKIAWAKGKRRPTRNSKWIFEDSSYQQADIQESVESVKQFAWSCCKEHSLEDLDVHVAVTSGGWGESPESDIVVYVIGRCNDANAKGDWMLVEVSEILALMHSVK